MTHSEEQSDRSAGRRRRAKPVIDRSSSTHDKLVAGLRNDVLLAVVLVAATVLIGVAGLAVQRLGLFSSTAPPASSEPVQIQPEIAPPPVRPQPLPPSVDCQYPVGPQAPVKPVNPPPAGATPTTGTVGLSLQTSAGTIPLTLDRSLAPCAVHSFLSLTGQGYFNDTPCHRLTTWLTTSEGLQVLQCGDPSGTGTGGPGYSFADETYPELTYGRGYLAMANSGPNTNGSQFFLVYGDAQLPPKYTVFGSISPEGLQVIDEIARRGHNGSFEPSPGGGAPIEQVNIMQATVR